MFGSEHEHNFNQVSDLIVTQMKTFLKINKKKVLIERTEQILNLKKNHRSKIRLKSKSMIHKSKTV